MPVPRSSCAEAEGYLHAHIPISSAMGVRVLASGAEGVTLGAPLAANINHRATVFGGSISAVAILSAWAWLHLALRDAGLKSRLVIQRNTVEYLAPISGDFEAHCAGVGLGELSKFEKQLRRVGKARLTLAAKLTFEGKVAAEFEGDYVALRFD
jgi:thioesterase domain-containing protein